MQPLSFLLILITSFVSQHMIVNRRGRDQGLGQKERHFHLHTPPLKWSTEWPAGTLQHSCTLSYHYQEFSFLSFFPPGSAIWSSRVLSQFRKTGSSTCRGILCTRVSPVWVQVWWRFRRCVKSCVHHLPPSACFWIHTLLSVCLRGSPKPRLHTSYAHCTPVLHMFINK